MAFRTLDSLSGETGPAQQSGTRDGGPRYDEVARPSPQRCGEWGGEGQSGTLRPPEGCSGCRSGMRSPPGVAQGDRPCAGSDGHGRRVDMRGRRLLGDRSAEGCRAGVSTIRCAIPLLGLILGQTGVMYVTFSGVSRCGTSSNGRDRSSGTCAERPARVDYRHSPDFRRQGRI